MERDGTDWRSRITADSAVLVGKPVIRGTRLSVEYILDLLEDGWTQEEVVAHHRNITLEDVRACLAYAKHVVQDFRMYPLPA